MTTQMGCNYCFILETAEMVETEKTHVLI